MRLITALMLTAPAAAAPPRLAPTQAVSPSAGETLVSHEFDESEEGWSIATDSGIEPPLFSAAGGNPGGCIVGTDEALGETWYFRAPPAVLQRLPAAENGTIHFSLKQSTNVDGGFLDDDVVIVGTGGRIGYRFPRGTAPGTAWKEFSVKLSASAGWTWNWGPRATQAQIRSVLATPLRLEIRGEFYTGDDEGSLDNFSLRAAPLSS